VAGDLTLLQGTDVRFFHRQPIDISAEDIHVSRHDECEATFPTEVLAAL
jgi:hypothetical protein